MDAEKVEKVASGLERLTKSSNCPFVVYDAVSVIRELKAEVEQLKYEKEKAVRDIGLYIADAEEDARTPSRIGKGYYVGEQHGLQIAKDIVEGIRNHG